MPWNPAILDQRIARVHRLGQKNVVQSIIITSTDSYEEHVISLVKGKRNLFNNVIDPEATEDVVGVSKKLLETLVEDLADKDINKNGDVSEIEADKNLDADSNNVSDNANDKDKAPSKEQNTENTENALETNLQKTIEAIQQAFGTQIEQILGSGGGILVVLNQLDGDANIEAQKLSSEEIPVAVIDTQTLGGLQRLGENSPIQTDETYFDINDSSENRKNLPAEKPESPLIGIAREKLEAAEILLEQEMYSVAANLLITAQLSFIAGKAELDQAPSPAEAGIWIYTEALENGWLQQEQANQVMKNLALVQAPKIPPQLIENLLIEVRDFIVNS